MSIQDTARGWSLGTARGVVLAFYLAALALAVAVGWPLARAGLHPMLVVGVADLAATFFIYGGSRLLGNSSLYDPYWSVAPVPVAFWLAHGPGDASGVSETREVLVLLGVTLWGVRLTGNWLYGWQGFGHEDWRYRDLATRSGRHWWLVSLTGVHLFPTLIVFAGMLPLYPALVTGSPTPNLLDLLAILVTLAAVALELGADVALHRHVGHEGGRSTTLKTGLWAHSRHPNYLGEILFWWGLALFGLAAGGGWLWCLSGAIAMTAMFVAISIPMIERRMLERRSDYGSYRRQVPMLVPLPGRSARD